MDDIIKISSQNAKLYPLFLIVLATSISAMGTVPYAYRFGQALWQGSHAILMWSVILVITAVLANVALGTYSLLNMRTKQTTIRPLKLILFSFLSAIPVGFMCYSAYQTIFAIPLNVIISSIVTLVNTAIGYTAVLNLYLTFNEIKMALSNKSVLEPKIEVGELLFRAVGLIIGVVVSLTAYMAAIHGITQLLHAEFFSEATSYQFAAVIGFLNWVPYAALFANGTQSVFAALYQFLKHFSLSLRKINSVSLLIFIVAWLSAASFAEIVLEYFSPNLSGLPVIFRLPQMQWFILHVLVPAAYLASFSVNYLAFKNVLNLGVASLNQRTKGVGKAPYWLNRRALQIFTIND
ncbi:MAG: hypothetical protein P4M14_10515 [Gammaproteobacteria bacterium]|nr:hypothetical protein [Gammaproteobacteria bacterium]